MKHLKLFELYKPLYKQLETGKEHSLRYDDLDKEFATYLRTNFYNVKMSNETIAEIRKKYLEEKE